MNMNSNKLTPHHLYQLAIFGLLFVVVLIATAWIYNTQYRERMNNEEKPFVTKEETEAIYGKKVDIDASSKAKIESIYGN
jgi:cbb3-type cytochrome oxidase subunit 3